MSLRNFDSSILTQRVLDKTNASFFNRNPTTNNSQTGNTAASIVLSDIVGSAAQYNITLTGSKQVDKGCNCS